MNKSLVERAILVYKKDGLILLIRKIKGFFLDLLSRRINAIADKTWTNRASYEKRLDRNVDALTSKNLESSASNDKDYADYIRLQLKKSFRQSLNNKWWLAYSRLRSSVLIDLVDGFLPNNRKDLSWVCIGCRDAKEINYVESRSRVGKVNGLDLYSKDSRIKVGDMQKTPFEDNEFDVCMSCHSLEHAYDAELAIKEFVRITKPGGIIAIEIPASSEEYQETEAREENNALSPVRFANNIADRWNFGGLDRFRDHLAQYAQEVLFSEQEKDQVCRVIIRTQG